MNENSSEQNSGPRMVLEEEATGAGEEQQEPTTVDQEQVEQATDALKEATANATAFAIAKLRKQAQREFKDWKQTLINILKTESTLNFNAQTGAYQFVLPPRLVKLVWTTTIKERVRYEELHGGQEGATLRAIEGIQAEVSGAVGQVRDRIAAAREQEAGNDDRAPEGDASGA